MRTSEIIDSVGILADDPLTPTEILDFLNDGIARINVEMDATFPFLDLANDPEPSFPEKWQRLLLIPFGAARIKQKDSSQFEYEDLYAQFEMNLELFKIKYTVPDELKDADSQNTTSVPPNFTGNTWEGGDW